MQRQSRFCFETACVYMCMFVCVCMHVMGIVERCGLLRHYRKIKAHIDTNVFYKCCWLSGVGDACSAP